VFWLDGVKSLDMKTSGKKLRLQIASDLHLEFLQRKFPSSHRIQPLTSKDADILILAGDIHTGRAVIQQFANWPIPVLWVAGNHEFYGGGIEELHDIMREQCRGTSITPMLQSEVVIAGVRFLGCTMWTDYELGGSTADTQLAKIACAQMLADHKLIRGVEKPEFAFTVQDALNLHKADRAWLAGQLAKPMDGKTVVKTVVITHHGPHLKSVDKKYKGNALNAGFVSDLSALMPTVDLWIHGHVHDNFDYQVTTSKTHNCRVVVNPGSYPKNLHGAILEDQIIWENPKFKRDLVVTV
jgi:predicted phosphodiesterase